MKFEKFKSKEEELSVEQRLQTLNEFEWQAISSQTVELLASNPDLVKNIEKGKYNTILIDDTSSRVSGLIMKNIVDIIYEKRDIDKAQVLFFAGDRDLLKKVESKDPVALVVGNTSFLKKDSEAFRQYFKDLDLVSFTIDKGEDVFSPMGSKSFIPHRDSMGHYDPSRGKSVSTGVELKEGSSVAEKVSDSQQEINRTRQMIKFVSHKALELYQNYDQIDDEVERQAALSRDVNLLVGEASDLGYIKTRSNSYLRHLFLKTSFLNDLEKVGLLEKEEIGLASEIAEELHKDQSPRSDGAYIYHILRVARRLLEEYEVFDPEIIVSAILHDSVEDQAKKLAEKSGDESNRSDREKALDFIKENFGNRVERVVRKLSNPEEMESPEMDPEEKNQTYKEHIEEIVNDPDAFLVKLSDFSDNVLNLGYSHDSDKRLKLSKKYLPVIDVFIDRLDSAQDILSQKKIDEIKEKLETASEEAKDFIESQEVL